MLSSTSEKKLDFRFTAQMTRLIIGEHLSL